MDPDAVNRSEKFSATFLRTLLCCTLIITLFSCSKKDKWIEVDPAFSKYVYAYTAGIVSKATSIRIQLAGAANTTHTLGEEVKEILFDISPAVNGKAMWVDATTIEFKPDEYLKPVNVGLLFFNKSPDSFFRGAITEIVFAREKKDPILYNGLKFASQTEVRIAQELILRKVLFFPLAVGVRAETGQQYKDQREVDFLICDNGIWGILEISGPSHNGRLADDAEKDSWLKKSGILCIEHRTAEQCYANPKKVTDEFLSVLAKHKR